MNGSNLSNVQNQSVTMCACLRTITSGVISNGMWAAIGVKQSNVGQVVVAMDNTDVIRVVIAVLVCAVLDALLVAVIIAIVIKMHLQQREKLCVQVHLSNSVSHFAPFIYAHLVIILFNHGSFKKVLICRTLYNITR